MLEHRPRSCRPRLASARDRRIASVRPPGRGTAEVRLHDREDRGAPRPAVPPRSPFRTRARRCGRRSSSRAPCRGRSAASSVPASAICRSRWPRSSLSRVSRPAAGSSRQRSRGSHRDRPRDPDELALPLRQLGRHRRRRSPPRSSSSSASPRRLAAGCARPTSSAASARNDGRCAADVEVLAHGEVVEQLGALPRPGEAASRPRVRRQPREIASRRARRAPV